MTKIAVFILPSLLFIGCHSQSNPAAAQQPAANTQQPSANPQKPPTALPHQAGFDTANKTIHVFVALCDNKHQGIIPVPPSIGNGQEPNSNLYWGCDEGVRTYFRKSTEWILVKRYRLDSIRLERLIFRHKTKRFFLVADAYDGRFIKQCTIDFLRSCAGQLKDTLHLPGTANSIGTSPSPRTAHGPGTILGIDGNARLTAYIGHDGLMDFRLANDFQQADNTKRDAIILACISKKYFAPFLHSAGATPLVWTTGLMCPEAYTLHDAVREYINGKPAATIRIAAAAAYNRNQRCGAKAAMNLLVSGF